MDFGQGSRAPSTKILVRVPAAVRPQRFNIFTLVHIKPVAWGILRMCKFGQTASSISAVSIPV
jgi:hypothetical protein